MRRASSWMLVTALGCMASASADQRLAELHEALLPLRAATAGRDAVAGFWTVNSSGHRLRYALPAMTPIRRQLRDWIEAQLATAPENVRERSFEARLNAALREADLFCRVSEVDTSPDRCAFEKGDWNSTGFVYPGIRVYRPVPGVLAIVAGLGIECGTDSSAYAYEWRARGWRRFWQSEQAIGKDWRPQGIDVVSVSEPDARGARHVMTLGNMDWCSSTYYPVYVRLWHSDSGPATARLLLDLEEPAWLNAGDDVTPPIFGRVTLTEARFEFMRNDRVALENHEAVVSYRIHGNTLTRVDPVARSPQAYVLEWLDAPWSDSRRWIEPKEVAKLAPWHRKLKSGHLHVEYPTTNACRDRGSWQVTFDLDRDDGTPGFSLYFAVVQAAPERFEIRDAGTAPRADCDGPEFGATEVDSG